MLSFYLLPALAVTLKIRKRKLAQTGAVTSSVGLITNSITVADEIKFLNSGINLTSLDLDYTTNKLNSRLNLLILQTEAFRQFNFSVLSRAHVVVNFYV